MNSKAPHIVQYQGSKRKLAPQILQYMPLKFKRLVEPFSGMAAISIATALEQRTDHFVINDLNMPLVDLLREAIEDPKQLISDYKQIWNEQFSYGENHAQHFYDLRDRFNAGEETPAIFLYLLARCVKGSVRYGKNGKFNQSPDLRRHGTNPDNLAKNVLAISSLLKGKTKFYSLDYREIFDLTCEGDLVYLDPPYQGVSNTRDQRYLSGVSFDEFVRSIEILNKRNVDFLISYDGLCADREYGNDLPECLGCKKVLLNAELSTQATLQGKKEITYEALYVSKSLEPLFKSIQSNFYFKR